MKRSHALENACVEEGSIEECAPSAGGASNAKHAVSPNSDQCPFLDIMQCGGVLLRHHFGA